MATHIPAWKRLGLKLKYAKEQPDITPTAISANVRDHDIEVPERPVKRRRTVQNDSVASPEQNDAHSSSDNPALTRRSREPNATNGSPQLPETSAGSLNQPMQRKKSVTFSDETKQEDGDSRITIDFPAGSPGSTPKRSKGRSKDEPSGSPLTTTNTDTDLTATNHDTKPAKKHSKPKTGKKSKQSKASTKDKSSSALDYLTLHRSARDSWKFNKILDVWILNHALDVQAIPSTHVSSLAGYVRGLPAKAGSRDRLIKESRETLSSSQLDGDTNDEDRNLFIRLIESQDGPLGDATRLEDFLQAHSRAAVLLWSLDEIVGAQQSTFPVKKKKSRTSAPIDISSSSESDSDNDSSDDSSDSDAETKTKSVGKSELAADGTASKDVTSSSGTSSSGDEDDDDSTSSSGGSSGSSSDDDK